ncbi:MAG: biopolymer transporter ExbD [Acidaminococcus sp.]|jgi:biopolymer transport protein ExbD|nr:biopolymer transporter ExbD [Acidaminococcus sp.]MCI2100824.1 biopolymer transporter ExbD [Acidaminococcus sp.]MCI2115187.1 biopolymer transporter ExbD [Acidaminococcus sp.]MCI2117262.1 biopolymer transporter ExbD [Acidaminococcus sp.]
MIHLHLQQGKKSDPVIQIGPMVDLIFLLLVVFIVSMMYMTQSYSVPVDVPQGSAAIVRDQAVDVAIKADGEIYWQSDKVTPEELAAKARNEAGRDQNVPVIIRADHSVSYGRVVGVMEILKKSGLLQFSLAVRPEA